MKTETIYKGEHARVTETTDRTGRKSWAICKKVTQNGRHTWVWTASAISKNFAREYAERLERLESKKD